MSTRLDVPNECGGTTDHSYETACMREHAAIIHTAHPDSSTCPIEDYFEARICHAAADLLEVHDRTGISLDDWEGPRKLIETALRIVGLDIAAFLPNGV